MSTKTLAALVLGFVAVGGIARADRSVTEPSPRSEEPAPLRTLGRLPPECRAYLAMPADVRDDTYAWNQALSLAGCLEDSWVPRVYAASELQPMLDELAHRIAPAMLIYIYALEHGPGPVQLRAAYHIAMVHVALITRARAALVDPALDVQLEPLLATPIRTARLSLMVIERAVQEEPDLAPDVVTREMVRSARATLAAMPGEELSM